MKNLIYLIFLLAIGSFDFLSATESTDETAFKKLDETLKSKNIFQNKKEADIEEIKNKLKQSADIDQKYALCEELFSQYLHYQADSSLAYIKEKEKLAEAMDRPELKTEIAINKAEVYGVMGMYNEAFEQLENIDTANLSPGMLGYYYRALRAYYGWLTDYTTNRDEKLKYEQKTNAYRDSILFISAPGIDTDIVRAEQYRIAGKTDSALIILQQLKTKNPNTRQDIYLNYTLSDVYAAKGDKKNQIYYLTLTAIEDIKMSVREYASLQKLAQLIYESGDVDRAYRYLSSSMEDAVACNARLRFIEATQFFPIINKAFKLQEQKKRELTNFLLVSLSILALFLIVAISYLYSWMRKLSKMRKDISLVNEQLNALNSQLKETNKELEQTGRIKETYIARYLDRCVSYLDKLDKYRASLSKLAITSRIDDLFKAIKSEQFIRDERKNFYNEFDKSFLELFPNFIPAFNALLIEEARIEPKSEELLTTELRIFALMRLGITDSTRIAHFLGYSLATIYNYRSKMRNKAKGNKDDFEEDVMKI